MWKVYEITTDDGRVYVGCTKQAMTTRLSGHKSLKMPFVMRQYSVSVIAEISSEEEAHRFEAYLIGKHDSTNPEKGYNRRFGGSKYGFPAYIDLSNKTPQLGSINGMFGRKHSEETKEKIRQRTLLRDSSTFDKNRHKTAEQLKKLHDGRDAYQKTHKHPMLGKTHTAETRQKISSSMKGHKRWVGRKHSEESKAKMRVSQQKRQNKSQSS